MYTCNAQRTVMKRYSFFSNTTADGERVERAEWPLTLDSFLSVLKLVPRERTPQQLQFVQTYTKNVTFFQRLAKEEGEYAHKQCCQALVYETYTSGQFVFHQGDEGNKFYIMLEGICGVLITTDRGSQEVRTYERGDSFGELALLKNQPRAAGILCKTQCHFAVLHREDYSRTVQRLHRKKLEEKVDFLLSQPMFKCWTKGSMTKLSYYFFERTFLRKQLVYKAGDSSNELYLIRLGEFRLLKELPFKKKELLPSSEGQRLLSEQQDKMKAKNLVEIASMTRGEMFGIEELFDGGPRTSTCMCYSGEAEAYVISREDFFKRVKNEEKLAQVRSLITARDSLRTKRLENRTNLSILVATKPEQTSPKRDPAKSPLFSPDRVSSPLTPPSLEGSKTERLSQPAKPSSTWDRILKRNFERIDRRKCREDDCIVNIHTQGRRLKLMARELEDLQSQLKPESLSLSPRATFVTVTPRSGLVSPVTLEVTRLSSPTTVARGTLKLKKSTHRLFRLARE